jgi:hypothetical protein
VCGIFLHLSSTFTYLLWFEVFQVSNGFLIKIDEDAAGSQKEVEDNLAECVIPPPLPPIYPVEPRWASSAILKFSRTLECTIDLTGNLQQSWPSATLS